MDREVKLIERALELLVAAFLALALVITFVNVAFRYLFKAPIFWSDELSRYLFVWVCFVGAALGLKRGEHIAVDYFVSLLPPYLRRMADVLGILIYTITLVVLTWGSYRVVQVAMLQRSPSLGLRMGWVYLAFPSSAILMILYSFQDLKKRLSVSRRPRRKLEV